MTPRSALRVAHFSDLHYGPRNLAEARAAWAWGAYLGEEGMKALAFVDRLGVRETGQQRDRKQHQRNAGGPATGRTGHGRLRHG